MKSYIYKIQWLFSAYSDLNLKCCYNVIKSIGSKSLTVINFLDSDMNIIDSYDGMISYSHNICDKVTIKHIRQLIKKNQKICFIELLRD